MKWNRGDQVRRFWLVSRFQSYFQKTRAFIEEDNPSEKAAIIEEGLNGIDIDDIGNLEDSPRLVFVDEECENLIVANNVGEVARNINQKNKSDVLHYSIDLHYLKNAVGERISLITMWNIVNQLGKHDFFCVSVVNNLKDTTFFLIEWVEIALTQFLLGVTGIIQPCRI